MSKHTIQCAHGGVAKTARAVQFADLLSPAGAAGQAAASNPCAHAPDEPEHPHEHQGERQLELDIEEILPYENNPRRARNAKFDDIKESIRTSGLRSPLTVTQRPGESHFIVDSGGNTRLMALRELWAETREPKCRRLKVLFRPWQSESHVLSSHLIENEQRAELSFWDKATGLAALKQRLQAEQARTLSLRAFEDALHSLGLSVNPATLGLYLFATERLQTLGEGVSALSGLDVKTLQPRLNALKRHAHAGGITDEDKLYATVFEPVFSQFAHGFAHTRAFGVNAISEACEVALAAHLGQSLETLREASPLGAGRAVKPATELSRGAQAAGAPGISGPTPATEVRDRAWAFATLAAVGHCLEPDPGSRTGYRLKELDHGDVAEPRQQRAWWLLASLGGQSKSQLEPGMPLAPDVLVWLIDAGDALANAFWELMACLRRSGAPGSANGPAIGS